MRLIDHVFTWIKCRANSWNSQIFEVSQHFCFCKDMKKVYEKRSVDGFLMPQIKISKNISLHLFFCRGMLNLFFCKKKHQQRFKRRLSSFEKKSKIFFKNLREWMSVEINRVLSTRNYPHDVFHSTLIC